MSVNAQIIEDNRILHTMKKEHPNLQLIHLNADDLFEDTILEHWYKEKLWEQSYWPRSHFNDILRWGDKDIYHLTQKMKCWLHRTIIITSGYGSVAIILMT